MAVTLAIASKTFVILTHLLVSPYALHVQTSAPQLTALASGKKSHAELDFYVHVPEGDGPFEVVILLHQSCIKWGSCEALVLEEYIPIFSHYNKELERTHILVVPLAADLTWNIFAEPSKRDDVTLVGTMLPDYLRDFINVQPTFKLIGFSNGAGLINRILIESDNEQIIAGVTCGSQLNQKQWHDGNFYIGGIDNAYTHPKRHLKQRFILQLTAEDDELVPASGGAASTLLPGDLYFLSWDDSAYRYAQAFKYNGEPLTNVPDEEARYLGDQVNAYNIKGACHTAADFFMTGAIETFLLHVATTSPVVTEVEMPAALSCNAR